VRHRRIVRTTPVRPPDAGTRLPRHAGVARREAADAAAGAGNGPSQRRGVLAAPRLQALRLPAVGEGQERPDAAAAGAGDGAVGPRGHRVRRQGRHVEGVLPDQDAAVDGQRRQARHAADEEQRREALHPQPFRRLQVGRGLRRRPVRQPLVVDPLQVAVLRQRQDRRRQVHGQLRVPRERLPEPDQTIIRNNLQQHNGSSSCTCMHE